MSFPDAGRVPFEPHAMTMAHDEVALDRVRNSVERVPAQASTAELSVDVEQVRGMLSRPAAIRSRRMVWMWLRVFVREVKANGRVETVNIRIPIPIPLIGALMPVRTSPERAARVAHEISMAEDRQTALAILDEEVASTMGLEFVRVQESTPGKGRETVVVGLD